MNRPKVLASLLYSYVFVVTIAICWGIFTWNLSDPSKVLAVKGISTEHATLQDTSSLAPYPVFSEDFKPAIQAHYYALYNVESGKLLYAKNEHAVVPIASTTKLMTSYIISKIGSLDDVVIVSREAVSQPLDSSLMNIYLHEKLTVESLLHGTLLASGNDAAYALAEYGGGILLADSNASSQEKVARFIEEMNAEAERLRMNDTHYVDPVGYNDEGVSSAFDVAKITATVAKVPELSQIMNTAETMVTSVSGDYRHDLRNSNRLVTDYGYTGVLAGKTGFTYKAGHCLATAVQRDGVTMVAVILHTNADTVTASAVENRRLLEAGFSSIRWK